MRKTASKPIIEAAGHPGPQLSSIAYSAALTAALMLLIFSAAVSIPLLWRGFYYMQIHSLRLTELTPWSYEEIREAYDEMMDFCMFGAPFGTGVLKWSLEGMRHFEDCRFLFTLDLKLLSGSAAAVLLLLLAGRSGRRGGFTALRPLGRGPLFWSGALILVSFVLLALLIRFVNFDRAFVTFHHLFFPGKSNWIFDPAADEIILILPEIFFSNCAILIASAAAAFSLLFMALDFLPVFSGRR